MCVILIPVTKTPSLCSHTQGTSLGPFDFVLVKIVTKDTERMSVSLSVVKDT